MAFFFYFFLFFSFHFFPRFYSDRLIIYADRSAWSARGNGFRGGLCEQRGGGADSDDAVKSVQVRMLLALYSHAYTLLS